MAPDGTSNNIQPSGITSTLCDLIGVEPPPTRAGRVLAEALEQQQ
jgi:hypothetical protein